MVAYYNEIEPYAAQWLRNLTDKNLISKGDVDERSICDVAPEDLRGYAQCHFFAGIGGWSHALRLAGWPDDRPIWTGSAPCQPFSVAGQQKGQADERHLWPVFFGLIRACRPPVVMGEQVAAAVGKDWLDGVSSDLEGIGYATGAVVVPACAVDAPHRRDRLWFVADAARERGHGRQDTAGASGGAGVEAGGSLVGDAYGAKRQQYGWAVAVEQELQAVERGGGGAWANAIWLTGADGKSRRVEPSIRLLAYGVPARVGKLRAYGNAIVPQVAAEVIGAYLDAHS
jgi:DNA (cytosine-5)-methyltransferase 1